MWSEGMRKNHTGTGGIGGVVCGARGCRGKRAEEEEIMERKERRGLKGLNVRIWTWRKIFQMVKWREFYCLRT